MRRLGSFINASFVWWHRNLHTALLLAAILMAMAWITVNAQMAAKDEEVQSESLSDLTNYTLLFEQDALRTVKELDRIILYLRRSYERLGFNADWSSLISDDFTISSRTVQLAIIDKTGMMVTSTAMLHPTSAIDLSDRDHFRAHVHAAHDDLYISKPVVGRASGRWSIQFTRRFNEADGSFGGVIVASLDPGKLVGTYDKIQSLPNAAFALIGSDDIVRAGAGAYAELLGRSYREGDSRKSLPTRNADIQAWSERFDGRPRLVASMPVDDLALSVVVGIDNPLTSAAHRQEYLFYYFCAAIFSAVVLVTSVVSVLRDGQHVKHMTTLAHHDALTGLQNRLAFKEALGDIYGKAATVGTVALHLIDLDRFKAVNDTYGHPVGDRLLVAVAERLRGSTRRDDRIYRLGGDEFALLQSDCQAQDKAGLVADRICKAMATPFEVDGQSLEIGCSIGIALTHVDAATSTGIQQAADLALYLAKSDGRDTHRFFNAAMNAELQRRRQLETELGAAAERGELVLFYQPKLGAAGVCGYEALIRWDHPERGLQPPTEFIGLAEETGLIVPIGEWVLDEACRCLAAQASEWSVAINVSPLQFSRSNVVAAVEKALAAHGVSPQRLEIEITETALMRGDKSVLSQLAELRKLGIKIALDDFGTGYSSLSYLHTYPIDCIKIDRSFVKTIGEVNDASAIIRAIVTMAGELNMTTVAEGVEDQGQLDALLAMGCTVFQGYLFGKPRSGAEIWPPQARHAEVTDAA